MKKKILISIGVILVLIFYVDYVRITKFKVHPTKPKKQIKCNENQFYFDLVKGKKELDWTRLNGTLKFIKNEYDCADFRFVNLIRILYEFENDIPIAYRSKIEKVVLDFRYWLDEPNGNSMCYWSENHQILFASAEYLIGQKYPNKTFTNNKLTGKQHQDKAKIRILKWLTFRWNYGFTEFYSNVYYKENIGALINLIDYANDDEIVKKSQIILDLLFYDMAAQCSNDMFVSVSGRAYERNRKGGNFSGLTNYYWGDGKEIGPGIMYGLMVSNKYILPPVLKNIAQDSSDVVIKQSNGLNIFELKKEGYNGVDISSLMMQWGMEAFVNPEIVRNSLHHIRSNNMYTNEFLSDFKLLDFTFFRLFHLEPIVLKFINPQYNGTAIQKGNTYTYRTKDYSMYTSQKHQVGGYADQQHVFGMNIKNQFAIFHNHPAVEKEINSSSPNYWVGYGRFPHSVQSKNINLSIYSLSDKKGLMEKDLLKYTHAYFPKEKFDSIVLYKNFLFGKKDETYCAIIGKNYFQYKDHSTDDIIQNGRKTFWIIEAGSKTQDNSFIEFMNRIKKNKIEFNESELELMYDSNGNKYKLIYESSFTVNEKCINTNYKRFDSPYLSAIQKSQKLNIKFRNESLSLDFNHGTREF